jgi:hypothetical protein
MSTSMTSFLPIAGYAHRGHNIYDPRISVHEQNVLDDHVNVLQNLLKRDHALAKHKKRHLSLMLNSPEYAEQLLAGFSGRMLMKSISHFNDLPKPAQTLLSLAGFGIGNIIYNELHEDKFSEYNPSSGKSRIKL